MKRIYLVHQLGSLGIYVPRDPSELSSIQLDIPVFSVAQDAQGNPQNSTQSASWTNNLGTDIGVVAGWIWIGADSAGSAVFSGRADIPYILQNVTTGVKIWWSNWDHYCDIGGIGDNDKQFSWAPYYVRIKQGDVVEFVVGIAGPYAPDNLPVSVQAMANLQWRVV